MNALLLLSLVLSLDSDILLSSSPCGSVFVREPMVRLVRAVDIPSACGKGANVEACTAFVGQAMECSCALSGSGWHVRTGARFIPVMYVTGPRWVAHEREHIEDIQSRVEAHLRAVEGRTFTSASQCESFAAAERATFPRLMDEYKRESNRMMHGSERDTAR